MFSRQVIFRNKYQDQVSKKLIDSKIFQYFLGLIFFPLQSKEVLKKLEIRIFDQIKTKQVFNPVSENKQYV